jgi:hypothetical protein
MKLSYLPTIIKYGLACKFEGRTKFYITVKTYVATINNTNIILQYFSNFCNITSRNCFEPELFIEIH